MKNIFLYFILSLICHNALAQLPSSVNNPVLHLDAATGFTPGVGTTPATWTNLASSSNNLISTTVTSSPMAFTFTPANGWAGTSFQSAFFDGGDYMLNSGTTSGLDGDEITIAIVCQMPWPNRTHATLSEPFISIANPPTPGRVDEFAIVDSFIVSGNTSTDYRSLYHSCYSGDTGQKFRPTVYLATFGSNTANIAYYMNGVLTSNTNVTQGSPSSHSTGTNRDILLGSRLTAAGTIPTPIGGGRFYAGYIFEVLVYDRVFSSTEITDLNDYLRCKYEIFYPTCNTSPLPSPCTKGGVNSQCIDTPWFQLNYLGPDITNNNCEVEITVHGTPASGISLVGYEITIPGPTSPTTTLVPASTYPLVYNFTINSPVIDFVKVRMIGSDANASAGTSPCCEYEMTQKIMCDAVSVWQQYKQGESAPIEPIQKTSKKESGIRIYPNPSFDVFYVETGDSKNYLVTVTDMIGQEVRRENTGGKKLALSLQNKPAGIYMVQVYDENGAVAKKLRIVLK